MITFDSTILSQVISQAKAQAADHPSWLRAIDKAADQLQTNPWIYVDGNHLIIPASNGSTYSSNGVCQCLAYANGKPCWHRAASRIVKRYAEAEVNQAAKQAKREAYLKAVADLDECFG